MRHIAVIDTLVHHQGKGLTVLAGIDEVLIVGVVGTVVLHRLVVVVIELDGPHRLHVAQVNDDPLLVAATSGTPAGAHVLVGEVCGDKCAVGARHLAWLAIGEEHPPRKTVGGILDVTVGIPAGVVTEGRVAEHHAILVKGGGIKSDATFKLVLERQHAGAHVPIVALEIGKGASMPHTLHKAARLVTHGVVALISERSQRLV